MTPTYPRGRERSDARISHALVEEVLKIRNLKSET
jgi:hypothetical protein